MKNAIIVVLFLLVLASQNLMAQDFILGCVDTDQVLQSSFEYKAIDSEARTKIELKEEEGQRMMQELIKMQDEIAALAADKRQVLVTEYQRKVEMLERFREQSRDEIMERQSLDLKRIANSIKVIIEQVSIEKKMTLVLEVKAILYQDKSKIVDITNLVIEKLNKKYDDEKEKFRLKAPKRVK